MAVISLPASVRIANINWALDRPAQLNRSQWTGKEQVIADPWHGRWTAEAELAPVVGEANVLAWRAFLAALKGRVNTFRLPAVEKDQAANDSVSVSILAAAGATTINSGGWGVSTANVMLAGQMFTLNDQLCVLTANASSNASGFADLTFQPPLRAGATVNTPIIVRKPTALVALASSTAGWSVDRGQVYGIKLNVEERF